MFLISDFIGHDFSDALKIANKKHDVIGLRVFDPKEKELPSVNEVLAGARKQLPGAIPIHAVRAGDIVGDHTVVLAGPSERLELTHRAHNREVFAQGALRAARFVAAAKPGLYDMTHVLKEARL